jgi:hypothetical protein
LQKLVCSFIRATKAGFPQLHDMHNIGKFVADFITYEPLDNPTQYVRLHIHALMDAA